MIYPYITSAEWDANPLYSKAWRHVGGYAGPIAPLFFRMQLRALDQVHHYPEAQTALEVFWTEVLRLQLQGNTK